MQIGVTNPLRTHLAWRPFPPNAEELPLFCWDAHRILVGDREMLVVCNAQNRFAGITAMREPDWGHLDEVCASLIALSMRTCGFSASAAQEHLSRAGAIEFGRTHGRSAVGCMNRLIDALLGKSCDQGEEFQAELTRFANLQYVGGCARHEGRGHAAKWMARDFSCIGIDLTLALRHPPA